MSSLSPKTLLGRKLASAEDVAHLAGVSRATVSNTLNHPDRVRPERRDRVLQAIEQLGYVPNAPARQLRSGRSNTIGLLLLDAWNPGFGDVARGVEEVVTSGGRTVLMANSGRDLARENAYLRVFSEQQVAGIVLVPHDESGEDLHRVRSRGIPVVVADRTETSSESYSVSIDDITGGRLLAEHLIGLGHRHIAFVGDPGTAVPVQERVDGIRLGISKTEVPVRFDIILTDLSAEGGLAAGETLALARRRPTAVVAAIDLVGFGLLQSLLQQGVDVPGDISLCGYDDIPFASQLSVPLTTVRRPHYELGSSAAELLSELIEGRSPVEHHRRFKPKLIVRESTGRPRSS